MNPATRAVLEAYIERKRAEFVTLMQRAENLDAERPEEAHPYDYLLAWHVHEEYVRTEMMVDFHFGEFTRRRSPLTPIAPG